MLMTNGNKIKQVHLCDVNCLYNLVHFRPACVSITYANINNCWFNTSLLTRVMNSWKSQLTG